MKFLIFLPFILTLSLATNNFLPILSTPKNFEEIPLVLFSYGFLSGSGLLAQIPDLENCVTNITHAKENIEKIIDLFEQKTIPSIGNGVILLGKTLADLIDDCGNTYLESRAALKTLKQELTNETFIIQGLQRVFANIGIVLQDLDNAKYDYQNGDYFSSGENAGFVIKLFLQEKNIELSLGNAFPFADCDNKLQAIEILHVYLQKSDINRNYSIILQGNVLDNFETGKINLEVRQGNYLISQKVVDMNGKKYKTGDKLVEIIGDISEKVIFY